MKTFSIVERELRVAARRPGTYWGRCLFAVGVLALALWSYAMMRRASPAQISVSLFFTMTSAAGIFCALAGVRFTADCLSEEKRDGTLGLLFLTDLRGYDVVFGKLVANSLGAFYGVLALLPMLAIPLLMGGVSAGQFARISLVLLNTLFLSLAVGLCVSAFATTARAAASWTLLVLLLFIGGLPLAGALLAEGFNRNVANFEPFFMLPTPGYAFSVGLDSLYRAKTNEFWLSLALTHAVGWAALGLACLQVPRSWQDRPASAAKLRWRERWRQWSLGLAGERADYRRRLLDVNAFYWLAARQRVKPALVWATLAVAGGGWLWAWAKWGPDWAHPGWFICTLMVLNTLMKFWFTAETCAQLAEDRRTGALELLLATPITVPEVLTGQALALRRQFLGPVIVVLGLHVVFLFAGLAHRDMRNGEGQAYWVFALMALALMLVADLIALFHVGLWQALTAKNVNRASGQALTRILSLPWLLFALVAMLLAMGGGMGEATFGGLLFIWVAIGLMVDFGFGVRARSQLESEFRTQAMARYAPPVSFWRRLFSPNS